MSTPPPASPRSGCGRSFAPPPSSPARPADITEVVGVYKAHMARVGNGPMPTELLDETGNILRLQGPRPEVGTTTGRPRRTGWVDGGVSRHRPPLERRPP